MIRVYKILKNTTAEGPGKRFCLWVQGCKKHCNGCYAKQTWDFDAGTPYSVSSLFEIIKAEKNNIEGVTFLGGEPFEQSAELSKLAQLIKNDLKLTLVCFSGYTYEELKNKKDKDTENLLKYIDLLIDGGFEEEKFDLSRPWVGSSNQNYIFLSDKYASEDILNYKNKVEVHIKPDGRLEINGMGDFKEIESKFCLHLGENIVK